MTPIIQDTLLHLFDHVRQDPDSLPTVPVEDWQKGSVEWQLLTGFQGMLEQMQQLREQEELYHSIFEATYDALNILDLDGFFVEVNPAFCDMFGYNREELIGLHVTVLAAPESLPILDGVLKTLH